MKSRVAAAGGPPELRRLARSFNEMADNVEDVLEQQRAFVADASHQLRNPLAALLLRIELLASNCRRATRRSPRSAPRASGSPRCSTTCSDLALAEHADGRPPSSPTSAALTAERVAAWRAGRRGEGRRG